MPRTARQRPLGLIVLFLLLGGFLQVDCSSPPQILDISPGRGVRDVPTNAPIRIHFDRAVERASVASRFSLRPHVGGEITWEQSNTLVFRHDTLDPSHLYTVVLGGGYRDSAGNVNGFNHGWSFRTEPSPELRTSAPAQGDVQVDPASYLTLAFSREMSAESFRGAVTFSPSVPFTVRSDPTDERRVLIAPRSLLSTNTDYQVSISGDALDQDGNHLPPQKLHFAVGRIRSLSRWITFVASESGADTGSGVWMVDEAGFPRLLEETSTDDFSWSPDGSNLLVRHPDFTWTDYPLGAAPLTMPFSAEWAAHLGARSGYVYLDGSRLNRLLPSGATVTIASGVVQATVSRDLNRIAFSQAAPGGSEIWAYDVQLRARYRVQRESELISSITWAPDGTRLAYMLSSGGAGQGVLKLKSLVGSAAATSVATGEIADPAWLADSSDLVFSARLDQAGKRRWRIFRVNTALPPAQLTVAAAISPADADADAFLPRPSPDGHQIAFLVGAPQSAQVWLMNADGTGQNRLTGFDSEAFPYSCRALHWATS